MQNAMGGSAKCKISIEDGRSGLRADYSAYPRNLARNARVFGIALPRGAGGASPGKGRTKPPSSNIKATSKPQQSLLIANRLRTQSHSKATPMLPQSHPQA